MNRIPFLYAAVALALLLPLLACKAEAPHSAQPGKVTYDTSEIDVTGFPQEAEALERILFMPFGEAAARLGSLTFEAKSHFLFSRGGEEYEQNDVYLVNQDSRGNFHVVLDTPQSRVEVYLVDETVHVRQDKGRLRHKPRRDIEAESWCELAFASMHQVLELYRPRLTIVDARPDTVEERQAMRYNLALADEGQPLPWPKTPTPTRLPVAPPARWRELARPLDLKGEMWVDAATGVLRRLNLEGRIEIADREVRPTQLTVRYEAAVTEIAKVASIKPPESIAEYRRIDRPGDLLDFFADKLPKEDEEEAKGPDAEP